MALAEAAALDAPEDLCQVVAAAAGLLGSETRRRLQLDDAAAGELFDALLGALDDARGMADASSDGVAQFAAALRAPVRATAGGAPLAADRARLALGQARNLSLDLRATATGGDARDSSAGDLASVVADVLASDLFAVGARRRLDATAAGADVAGAVDDIATALVAGAVDDEAPAAVASGGLAIAAARASASAALDAGGAAAEYTSPDGPFVVALSALDGAGYHAAPVAAAKTLRFSRSAAAGDGRRRLANATFPGNVTLAVPAGDARGAAATGAVANATVYCPWNYVGPVYGTCPADNSTVEYACDRVGGEFRVLCGELLVDACVGWDGGAWDPGACAEDPERSTANATACVCALPEDGGARDYSTATTARSFAKAYLRNLVGPVDPEKSAVILGFLGVVVFASALAAICGHRLDKRDASLRRGRRLVLSHSSSFLLGASTRDLAKTLGDKRATHGGAPPLIHLPGSRPRTSPNDEEAASPADERGADLLAAGWRARRVRSLFRGAFRPKSSSRAQVAPLRRRVSAAAPADDGVAEGLQGSAAAGRADHRVGGADRHAHGGRGARDAAGVPGPEVRRAKVGPEMSKVHGGLQRPRALPVGRRERDLQRQPAAGRRLWRLFAPAGGALRHRDHAAVPEGVRVGRARRPGADLALLGAPVARRRGCGRAGRARGAGGRRARGARRSLRSRVGRRLCSVRREQDAPSVSAQAHSVEGAARELRDAATDSLHAVEAAAANELRAVESAVRAGGRAERASHDPDVPRAAAPTPVPTPSLGGGGGGGAPPRPEDDAPPASPARRAWDAVSPRLRAVLAFREASRTTTPTPPHDFADDGADEAPPRPPSQDPPPPRVASAGTGGFDEDPDELAVARLVKPAVAGEAGAIALDSTLDDDEADDEGAPDAPGEDPGDLPWRECFDDARGRNYFFNVFTGESRWRPPAAPYVPYSPRRAERGPADAAGPGDSEALGPALVASSGSFLWRRSEGSRHRARGRHRSLSSLNRRGGMLLRGSVPWQTSRPGELNATPTQAPGLCPFWGSVRCCQRGSSYPLKKKLPRGASTPKELRGHAIAAEPRSSKPCPRPSRGRRTARATCCARRRFRELSANRRVS